MNSNIFFLILATEFQANHNKDYSVVKTLGSFPLPLAAGFFIMIEVMMQKTVGEWSPYEAVFRCQCGTISFSLFLH